MSVFGYKLSSWSLLIFLLAAITIRYVYSILCGYFKPSSQLPPGPRRLPLIGNLLDLPPAHVKAETFWSRHRESYGPISSLSVFDKTYIILNDAEVVTELLEKRAKNYSDRPAFPFLRDVVEFEAWGFEPENGRQKTWRKHSHAAIGTVGHVTKWASTMDIESHRFLYRLLQTPHAFDEHISRENVAVAASFLYGYTVEPSGKDPLVESILLANHIFNEGALPGRWLVDSLPALQHIPEWMPGASFKRTGREWKKRIREAVEMPFQFAKEQVRQGNASPSVISIAIDRAKGSPAPEEENDLKWATLSLFVGATDTSHCLLKIFFLALALFPDAQQKAQAEIDTVVGTSRLPAPSDRKNLPYVEAYLLEVFRWEVVGSLSVPRTALEEDHYQGYRIPKGAVILPHTAGFLHDLAAYSDAYSFKPERFLGPNPERSLHDFAWGWGRRVYPGRHLADAALWMMVARTLAAFDVKAIKGREPKVEFVPGVVNFPKPFHGGYQDSFGGA